MPFTWDSVEGRKQLFLNFKGGTGKTTLSAIYGLLLAELGYRILFIDVDPQGHLTKCVGKNEWHFDKTLYHILIHDEPIHWVSRKLYGLSAELIPANITLSATELSLSNIPFREWKLVHALAPIKKNYDVIIMDASPAISLLNLNTLLAADDLIVPSLPDTFSLFALDSLFKILKSIQQDYNQSFQNIGIILNRFDPKDKSCIAIQKELNIRYPQYLLRTVIHLSNELANQPFLGKIGSQFLIPSDIRTDVQKLIEEITPKKRKEITNHE